MVGAFGAGAVDVDDADTNEELRRQPYVAPGCEISSAALPESKGRS